jgi:DNA polymerase-1
LVIADYSQFELRALAEMSQDPVMTTAFQNGEDLHAKTAQALFGPGFTKEHRQIAKTFNFQSAYGSGPQGLADKVNTDVPGMNMKAWEAAQHLKKFYQTYPVLKAYLDRSQQFGKDECWCATPSGRKRWFTRPDPSHEKYKQQMSAIGREAGNMPIQGCNADCTKIASALFDANKVGTTQILMWVHDEIVVQVETDFAEFEAKWLQECMIEAGKRYLKTVPVEVSITIGDKWCK